jgi:8-oxo-dGTP pyrophosphatase MutT (NUDIX family)
MAVVIQKIAIACSSNIQLSIGCSSPDGSTSPRSPMSLTNPSLAPASRRGFFHVGQSLLLLHSSYRSAWNFPGGSVRQGETPEVSVRRELAEEIGLVANAPLQLVGEVCSVWDGRIDRVFLFVLRLDRLPTLQLDNREIIGAQLVPIDDLHKVPLTGPVQAYVRGQFSPIDGGAAQSFS